jgi:hypothetical protein
MWVIGDCSTDVRRVGVMFHNMKQCCIKHNKQCCSGEKYTEAQVFKPNIYEVLG